MTYVSPNLKGVAQKMSLSCPFEDLGIFGGKSIFVTPGSFIFCACGLLLKLTMGEKFKIYLKLREKILFKN